MELPPPTGSQAYPTRCYFPTKEDLVVRPLEDHVEDPARVVRERAEDAAHPDATANAEQAFDLLETGLGEYCVRR